jgi:hypothetical protein
LQSWCQVCGKPREKKEAKAMSDIAELHAQLDHDWSQVLALIDPNDVWTARDVVAMWTEERQYVIKYGRRQEVEIEW